MQNEWNRFRNILNNISKFSEINIVKYEYNSDLLIVEVALGKEIPVEQEKSS